MPTPRSKLSKFILSLPATMSATEVVATATGKGMKTSTANVYRARRLFGGKAATSATSKSKAPKKASTKSKAPKRKPTTPKTSKKPQSKVGFIRSLPASMRAAKVVAKAKTHGLKIAESYVHWARWQSKSAAKKKATKVTATATKPASASSSKPTKQSKAAFIRSLPTSMPAKDVVANAKAAGLTIHLNQVYKVRGRAKATTHTKVTKLAARRATRPRKGASVSRPIATMLSAEDLLRALGAEIGLGRAVGILAEERARLRELIGA